MKMETEEKSQELQKKNIWRDILDIVIYVVVLVGIVFLVQTFIGCQVEVRGSSMETTLQNRNRLLVEKVSYYFSEPDRFDVIVFRPYEEEKETYYIKRVIGLPGETIQIKDGYIYINGEYLDEAYGNDIMVDAGLARDEIVLGEDEFFVLGDNRNGSKDSRFIEVGNVKKDSIMGRAAVRIWPFKDMEVLDS